MSRHSEEIELEFTFQLDGALITATAFIEVDGEYHPATWGADGGSPEEYPDATVTKVVWSGETEVQIDLDKISPDEIARLEDRAIERVMAARYDSDPED